MDLSYPQVMGILNVTPDSFYAGSRKQTETEIAERTLQIVSEGGSIIDVGAYSSRSNAEHISAEEEMSRLRHGLEIVFRECPDAIVSVDTFRADVARMCVEEYGAAIINDIAAGNMDENMFATVARLGVPYIMMHMQGTPQNMQQAPHYDNVLKEVLYYFSERYRSCVTWEPRISSSIRDSDSERRWNTTTSYWTKWKNSRYSNCLCW